MTIDTDRKLKGRPAMTRRGILARATASAALMTAAPGALWAQDAQKPAEPVPADATPPAPPPPFTFDTLTEQMRDQATKSPKKIPALEGFLAQLGYDDYRKINFNDDRARWKEDGELFRLEAYHIGWLFKEPVHLYELNNGQPNEFVFSTDDFNYRGDLAQKVPQHFNLPGVGGFRLHYPFNRADTWDELVSFLGASYFRALGRGNSYGLSARGLAINTGLPGTEEFPRFTSFWLQKPQPGQRSIVLFAALESPSVTGAYRFEITPGLTTVMDVTARLFFRAEVKQLGVAPLTSMFLFDANNREQFNDYRAAVHDSDGLRVVRGNGDVLWRALNNPPRLSSSVLAEQNPKSFGLYQRARKFEDYQDAEARYETRPSLSVEPLGDWGKGTVRLVEIPSDLEVNDNIVAFWSPDGSVPAGDSREYHYRLRWGALDPDPEQEFAYVADTRAGHAGVSGSDAEPNTRKFVVDFKGGALGALPADAEVKPVIDVNGGQLQGHSLQKVEGEDLWRLALDVKGQAGGVTELVAHIAGFGRRLSENWLYQWVQE